MREAADSSDAESRGERFGYPQRPIRALGRPIRQKRIDPTLDADARYAPAGVALGASKTECAARRGSVRTPFPVEIR